MQKEYTQTKEQVLEGLRGEADLVSAVRAAAEGSHAADPAGGGSGVRRDQYPVHESFTEVIIILLVVLLNAVLGVVQESKAEAAIEALRP